MFCFLFLDLAIREDNERIYSDVYNLAHNVNEKNIYAGLRYTAITTEPVEYIHSTDSFRINGLITKACDALETMIEVPCKSGTLVLDNASEYKNFSEYQEIQESKKKKKAFIESYL